MTNKINLALLWLLIIFAIYCAFIVGLSWDTFFHIDIGDKRLKYLLSLGRSEYSTTHWAHLFYPGFFDTISAFITKMFPKEYEMETLNIVRSIFSISAIFGISKISKELFNKQVAKIVFILCFFNPIFFGHMAINPKDTIIAFSNVWSTYLILKYLKNQDYDEKRNQYIILLGLCVGLGLGVRVAFLGTLLPILLFAVVDMTFLRKITHHNFSYKKLTIDIIKVLIISYFLMVSCWPETHGNILILPFKIIIESFSDVLGVSSGMLSGNFYLTSETPKNYLLINFLYKTPEFILFCYLLFVYILLKDKNFFNKNFNSFNTKVIFILSILLFPNILLLFTPYRIVDGLRVFLFLIPYTCIIPALTIYYLIKCYKNLISKILLTTIFSSFVYYLFVFFPLTPYQYTYLNVFNGDFSKSYNKFENDYWTVSIKELVSKIRQEKILLNNSELRLAFCGVAENNANFYLNKIDNFKFKKVNWINEDFDYIMMTNRVIHPENTEGKTNREITKNLITCFDRFKGIDVISVKRKGLLLSTLRKVN
jgi:hypothetical protein